MRLTMKEKRKVTETIAKRYQKKKKKDKSLILDEYTKITGYNRDYAGHLLSNWGKKIYEMIDEKAVIYVLGRRKRKQVARARIYGEDIVSLIRKFWTASGFLCGKLLKEYICDNIELFRRHEEIKANKTQQKKLRRISATTLDRLLKADRKTMELKKRSGTRAGNLLKNRIPIRTYADWNEDKAGFVEMDLVEHNGGDPSGTYINTLNVTDIKTCWTEPIGVLNKARIWVFQGIKKIEARMPFKILGIDSDNGGEFINHHLVKYCEDTHKTFTRSRASRKNDNCYIEQKNYTVVRKEIGYQRYEGELELKILNEIYERLRLIINFFTPTMKLICKERIGSKIIKKYDKARTPYRRILELNEVDEKVKKLLTEQRMELNPVALRKEILLLKKKLDRAASKRRSAKTENMEAFQYGQNYVY
jgi:hypothetical protein